ncbi:hypothetical protein Lesp02_33040 [Lentzea sp. NBRC 105346]|nr:hypothetical protein Lesp02_33040 [Lentzea sp. NBRC 105346]
MQQVGVDLGAGWIPAHRPHVLARLDELSHHVPPYYAGRPGHQDRHASDVTVDLGQPLSYSRAIPHAAPARFLFRSSVPSGSDNFGL